jgi:transketolase
MRPLTARFEGFGLNVHEVDGHSVKAISAVIEEVRKSNRPSVIVCNTVKGRDVPFAEWQPIWHYKSLSDEQYAAAMAHLDSLEVVP